MATRLPLVYGEHLYLPEQQGPGGRLTPIEVESEAWYEWLAGDQNRSFHFKNRTGTCTVRCERKRRGWYWYAYSKREGKLQKTYLGKGERLTLSLLNNATETLARRGALRAGVGTSVSPSANSDSTEEDSKKHNLPIYLTSLIGREQDVHEVATLLRRPDVRLVTLTGAGGIGKTRLAVQVGAELLREFLSTVCFVCLASVDDVALVLPTVARTLGLRETGNSTVQEQLYAHLRMRHSLLVLDNFEQLMAAAPLLVEMLVNCPNLKILVTSRSVLHAHGEHEYPVAPLAFPGGRRYPSTAPNDHSDDHSDDHPTRYASVTLFLDRARARESNFLITQTNAHIVAEICARLDGLPLAIELAARWVKVLSLEQIAARLDDACRLLTDSSQAGLPRHQTIRATLDWSYSLLSEQEQAMFCKLSVFAGGCTLQAVESVCLGDGIEVDTVLELLSHLVDHSLVYTVERGGEVRYRLPEVVQQYGRAKLEEQEDAVYWHRRHRDWFLEQAEQAEHELVGRHQSAWLARLEEEQDNLRAALWWSLQQSHTEEAARLGASIWPFWLLRGYLSEGSQWLDRTLEQLPEHTVERTDDHTARHAAVRAKLLLAAGIMAGRLRDTVRAARLLEQSLTLWRILGDKRQIAFTLYTLGVGAQTYGDYELAAGRYRESLAMLRELGDGQALARVLSSLGLTLFYRGDYRRARQLTKESLALFRAAGDTRGIAAALTNLALMSLEHGEYQYATDLCGESLSLRREVGDKGGYAHTLLVLARATSMQNDYEQAATLYAESMLLRQELEEQDGVAAALEGLAVVWAAQGDVATAARLLGSAEAMRQSSGIPAPPMQRASIAHLEAHVHAQMGVRAFADARNQGRVWTLDQAVMYAMRLPHMSSAEEASPTVGRTTTSYTPSPALILVHPDYPYALTAREVEVLRLVAQGLSNKGLAQQLVISPRTVQGHLRSIYAKIDVNSRSAATRYAIEHKLV